jgi:hypothetical protein
MDEALTVARSIRPEAILVGASLLHDANSEKTAVLHAALPDSCIFVVAGDGEISLVLAKARRFIDRRADALCDRVRDARYRNARRRYLRLRTVGGEASTACNVRWQATDRCTVPTLLLEPETCAFSN